MIRRVGISTIPHLVYKGSNSRRYRDNGHFLDRTQFGYFSVDSA